MGEKYDAIAEVLEQTEKEADTLREALRLLAEEKKASARERFAQASALDKRDIDKQKAEGRTSFKIPFRGF